MWTSFLAAKQGNRTRMEFCYNSVTEFDEEFDGEYSKIFCMIVKVV